MRFYTIFMLSLPKMSESRVKYWVILDKFDKN